MLATARQEVKDWTKRSVVNKSMTIAVTFNIYVEGWSEHMAEYVKANIIREFGEYLPVKYKGYGKIANKPLPKTHHVQPINLPENW